MTERQRAIGMGLGLKNIQLTSFNSCDPGSVTTFLLEFYKGRLSVKDLGSNWVNASDTLVIKLKSVKDVQTAVEFALKMKELSADEIHVRHTLSGVFIRVWWD